MLRAPHRDIHCKNVRWSNGIWARCSDADGGTDESMSPQFGISARILTILKGRSSMSGWESIGFSGEVDPPLDGHKIESGSMVALRCKRGETGLSHLVHLTERVLVIHR